MRVMSTHLPFDTSQLRWTASMVHGLHDRLTMMVPLLLAVEDRLTRCAKPIPKAWRRGPRCWTISPPGCRPAATPIRPAPRNCARTGAAQAGAAGQRRLERDPAPESAQRLDALIEACEDGLELRSNVSTVMQGGVAGYTPHLTPAVLHRDHGMALRSALAAVVTILLCCAFWIFTAWPSGAAAPMMAGVACCFFATQDNPVPLIRMFVKWTVISMPVGRSTSCSCCRRCTATKCWCWCWRRCS
jgi:hypothetical protein